MAIKISNETVIDDSKNLTNIANSTLGLSGSNTTTIVSQVSANGGVGASGQVLTSRGSNLSPEWTTVTGGGGGGGVSTVILGTPSIFPVLGNSILGPFISSAFVITSGEDAHKSSDWQFSESATFTSFTYQALNTQGAKIQLFVPEGTFTPGTTYYVRVRHRSWSGAVSEYSSGRMFVATSAPNTNLDVVPIGDNLYKTVVNSTNGTILALSNVYRNIYRSVDNGVTFTRVFTTTSSQGFYNAAYSPSLNMFLVFNTSAGTTASTTVYYSTDDGLTWQNYVMPTTLLRNAGQLVWNPNNSKFYAVGNYSSTIGFSSSAINGTTNGSVISSTDGLNWVQHAPSTLNTMYRIAFSSDNRFIAAGAQSEYIQSADGVTWTVQSTIAGISTLNCLALAYSPTLNLWSYIPGGNISSVYTSTDRINWTAAALAENINVFSSDPFLDANYTQYYWDTNLARFMLNMVYSSTDNTRYLGESTNGTTFQRSALTTKTGNLNTYNGSTYLLATNGEKFLRTGVATYASQGSDFVTSTINQTLSCDFDNTRFVASCNTGLVYSTDSTGRKWKNVAGISDSAIYKVVFVNNLWRAYSLNNTYGSTDGIIWSKISSSPAYYVWQIIYNATLNNYIGIGSTTLPTSVTEGDAVVFTSPDAATFTVVKTFATTEDFDYYPSPIEYNQAEQAYVLFFGATTYTSTNGAVWVESVAGTSTSINDSLYSSTYNKFYLAATNNIYTSKAADVTNRFKFRRLFNASFTFSHIIEGSGANAGVILVGTTAGNIYRSSDGINFTSVNSGLNTPINNLKYVNNLFMALSNSGLISYSSDGITWTVFQMLSNTTHQIFDVAYTNNGNYVFLTRGVSLLPSHYTSSLTVQAVASTYSTAPATGGTGSFAIGYSTAQNIAVFVDINGYIFYSSNGGVSYTRVQPVGLTTTQTYDIQYFPHISKWLTCSSSGNIVSTSTNGTNWTTVTTAFASNPFLVTGMQYVPHENRIYFKSSGASNIRYTDDGSTFTLETISKNTNTAHVLAADSKTYVLQGAVYHGTTSTMSPTGGLIFNKKSGSGAWSSFQATREVRRSVVLNNKNYRFIGDGVITASYFEDAEDFYLVKDYITTTVEYNNGMRSSGSYLFCCSTVGDVAYTSDGINFTTLTYSGKAVSTTDNFLDIAISNDSIFVTNFAFGKYGFFVSQNTI